MLRNMNTGESMCAAQRYLCVLILMLTGLGTRDLVATQFYVATDGLNTDGMSWSTAFTSLANAWPSVQEGDTVYIAGQTFLTTSEIKLDARTGVSLLGGYQAASDDELPGANDPTQWPTILERDSTVDYSRNELDHGLYRSTDSL